MFFSKFPDISYEGKSVKDLSIAIIIKEEIKNNKELFFWYEIEQGETPEALAFDFYGSTTYNYVVLLMNDIVDPFYDWPLNYFELDELCIHKYGEPSVTNNQYAADEGFNQIHHWIYDGIKYQDGIDDNLKPGQASLLPADAVAVTMKEYEIAENEKKRRIKILYPEFVSNLQKELDTLING